MKKILLFTLLTPFMLTSCYNDNEDDIYSKFNTMLTCDTIDINYEENIRYIFNTKCVSCHDASHPSCKLNNFNNAQYYASMPNTNLYTYVEGNNHQGTVLTNCELKQLKLWIENGAN